MGNKPTKMIADNTHPPPPCGGFPDARTGVLVVGNQPESLELMRDPSGAQLPRTDVFDTAAIGMAILDADLTAVWINQTFKRYFNIPNDAAVRGRQAEEVVESFASAFFEEPEDFAETLLRHFHEGVHAGGIPCRLRPGEDGEAHWLEYRSTPIRSGVYAGGRIEYFIDITALKRLESQLLQAQKMESIGRLAAGIAHDFNNLLTSIIGFSHLLLDKLEPGPATGDVREIISASERAAALVRQLLAAGHRQVLEVRPIDLNALVKDMARLLRRTLGEDIELQSCLEAALPLIEADTSQIEQIMMNLAVNARDAMPHGGRLTIRTATLREPHQPVRVLLSFADTGAGMAAEVRERAFEPFFTTKAVDKGTGLGLATVHGIIRQLGGHAEIISAPGGGCEIRVIFPATETAATPFAAPATPPPLSGGSETILVVEDDDALRRLTIRFLDTQGYHTLKARHGEEALAICHTLNNPIDLLLTDVVMPFLNGPQLAEKLRPWYPNMRVLYLSGFSEERLSTPRGARLELLPKPYTRAELLRRVRDILDRRSAA